MARKVNRERDAEIRRLWDSGQSVRAIARGMGVSIGAVSLALKRTTALAPEPEPEPEPGEKDKPAGDPEPVWLDSPYLYGVKVGRTTYLGAAVPDELRQGRRLIRRPPLTGL